jgi:hypothetical protein
VLGKLEGAENPAFQRKMTSARYPLYRAVKTVQGGGPESLKLEA